MARIFPSEIISMNINNISKGVFVYSLNLLKCKYLKFFISKNTL